MLEDKGSTSAADRVGDAARATKWNSTKIQWQTNPVAFRAVRFEQINPVFSAKLPNAQGTEQVNAIAQRHCDELRAKFRSPRVNLTIRITDQPCPMPVRVEPVYLQTGPILLAAPTVAALHVQNVHR